jgi:hypothetical protein
LAFKYLLVENENCPRWITQAAWLFTASDVLTASVRYESSTTKEVNKISIGLCCNNRL